MSTLRTKQNAEHVNDWLAQNSKYKWIFAQERGACFWSTTQDNDRWAFYIRFAELDDETKESVQELARRKALMHRMYRIEQIGDY